jgi:hypothetical protein
VPSRSPSSVEIVLGEEQVLHAGLRPHRLPSGTRGAHLRQRSRARQVNHVQRRTGQLCDCRGAPGGFGFERRGARGGMVLRGSLAGGDRLADQQVDDVAVLAVHKGEQVRRGGRPHDLVELRVVELQTALVGHQHLDRRDPPLRQAGDLAEDVRPRVGDGHVESVVDEGLTLGAGLPLIEGLAQRAAPGLDGEVDVRRRASERRGGVAGDEIIARGDVLQRHVEMCVDVDPAGEEEAARAVDDPRAVAGEIRADRGDALALNEDIGTHHLVCVDDRPARKQQPLTA